MAGQEQWTAKLNEALAKRALCKAVLKYSMSPARDNCNLNNSTEGAQANPQAPQIPVTSDGADAPQTLEWLDLLHTVVAMAAFRRQTFSLPQVDLTKSVVLLTELIGLMEGSHLEVPKILKLDTMYAEIQQEVYDSGSPTVGASPTQGSNSDSPPVLTNLSGASSASDG